MDIKSHVLGANDSDDEVLSVAENEEPARCVSMPITAHGEQQQQQHQQQQSLDPQKQRRSSLELRKQPVNGLLAGDGDASCVRGSRTDSDREDDRIGFLQRTCFNSRYAIRTQMMLSFGTMNSLTILFVLAVSIVLSIMVGDSVKIISHDSFDLLSRRIEGTSARFIAENLALKLIPNDLIKIIHKATQDRFAGYPDHPGYDEDQLVPFWDMESESYRYPIVGHPLPLDWQIESNVNDENHKEHVQNRWNWYKNSSKISTVNGCYYMQGMCDPSATDPSSRTYYPNCTEENNNIATGGVVAPSPTNYQIHRKASDLTPLFKALYEHHQEIRSLGLYFANAGSGATFQYPHQEVNTEVYYESIGCDWLLETPHPYNSSRPIIADATTRNHIKNTSVCRPKDAMVSSRMYNPLERGWCQDQALHPHQVRVTGPYADAFHHDLIVITVGKAAFDPLTSEFIGCIAVDFVFDSLDEILQRSRLTSNAEITVVRYDGLGTVVASSATATERITTIDKIDAGVTEEVYQSLFSLVDYSHYGEGGIPWDAKQIGEIYEHFVHHDTENGYHVAGYPIPPPPEQYDPDYTPEFMAIVAVPTTEVYNHVDAVIDDVNEEVFMVVRSTLIVGLTGLGFVVLAIAAVSHSLTYPLQYMNDVASDIFNKNFGGKNSTFTNGKKKSSKDVFSTTVTDFNDGSDDFNSNNDKRSSHQKRDEKLKFLCRPKTEIDEVVNQFETMVSNFSGSSMAKSMKVKVRELRNEFPFKQEFKTLYLSRANSKEEISDASSYGKDFHYNFSSDFASSPSLKQIHVGSVSNDENGDGAAQRSDSFIEANKQYQEIEVSISKGKSPSALFVWIVTLMVLPFLLTTMTTSGIVLYRTSQEFTKIIDHAKIKFVNMEKTALNIYVRHRANLVSTVMHRPVGHLHVLTRYAQWLLFDGVKRAPSFTELRTGDDFNSVVESCGCSCTCYGSIQNPSCSDGHTRHSLKPYFYAQSSDNWPNGDRNFTTSLNGTTWYENVTSLPGSDAGALASGYDTTYSRMRVLSAFPFFQGLFSQDLHLSLGTPFYVGYEADGAIFGSSCSKLKSRNLVLASKKAARSRPDICPLGKVGYDARCRPWYNNGKNLFEKDHSHLFVTPPYLFANQISFAQTCTSPIENPLTGEYVGQTATDFLITEMFDYLSDEQTPLHDGGFPILITSKSDIFSNDTVIGPGFDYKNPLPISDVVFGDDPLCRNHSGEEKCENRQIFQDIVEKMKAGSNGTAEFSRTTKTGSTESIYMAYAPVSTRSYHPYDNSDFSRGVNESEYFIYSLALAETEEGLLLHFTKFEQDLNNQVTFVFIVLISVIAVVSIFVIYISYRVAVSITKPMLYLLGLIGHINRLDSYSSAPKIDVQKRGHSLEVANVSKTMESLYHVVRCANIAFFTGDIEHACSVLSHVLMLYRTLDNEKGIGIASNNLGNLMLTMYRTMEATRENSICGFTKRHIISKGMGHFHEAIQLGEKAYDAFYNTQGWTPFCLEFMQHLANRYFNRAMFLLTVKDFHEQPKEIEALGLRDLEIARDMDVEIIDEGSQAGWCSRPVDKMFDVKLNRIRGHLSLQEMGYPDDWEVNESLEDAFKLVRNELEKEDSPLFKDIYPAGRMQQIETELMRYKLLKGDVRTAAKIAIRMLVEDEYTLIEAQQKAVEVLVSFTNSPECWLNEYESYNRSTKAHLLEYRDSLSRINEELILCSMMTTQKATSDRTADRTALITSSRRLSSSLRESIRGDFTMEMF